MPEATVTPITVQIARILETEGASEPALLRILDRLLAHLDCALGTIHRLDPATGLLQLAAQRGLPATLIDRVSAIPVGKGMAGLAAERRQPVQVCNLQSDASGTAKPGAKETKMEGSIAVPMLVGDALRGVLGVAKPIPYEFGQAEIALLNEAAILIGKSI